MTVGELRKALDGITDDMLVSVENQGQEVVARDAGVMPASKLYGGVWNTDANKFEMSDTFYVGVGGVF